MPLIGKVQKVPIKSHDIEWKIENFSDLEKDGICYYSPEFSYDGESWFLGVDPNGDSYNDTFGYINLYLYRKSSGPPINLKFSISLKTANGKKNEERHCMGVFEQWNHHQCLRFISISELENRKTGLLPSDTLTVVCTIQNSKSVENASGNSKTLGSYVLPQKCKILEDFKQLFENQEDCDVVIRVKEKEFPAHKAILKVRSPVFASTLRNDMKEKQTGIIDIQDCEPSVFSDFLCFLYYEGTSNLSVENVFGLFTLSDMYDVPDLRKICLEFMKVHLSVETFCDTITLALKHSETELIKLSTDFFIKNAQMIIETVKWQSFLADNPTQSNELFIKLLASNKSLNA